MLAITVQFLMTLYIKLILNWTKRQIQANSDSQGHNGTGINSPGGVQVCIIITF